MPEPRMFEPVKTVLVPFHVEQCSRCKWAGPSYAFVSVNGKRRCVRCCGCKEVTARSRAGQFTSRTGLTRAPALAHKGRA